MSQPNFNYQFENPAPSSPGYFSNYFTDEFMKTELGSFAAPQLFTNPSSFLNTEGTSDNRAFDTLSDSYSSTNYSSKHSPDSATEPRGEDDTSGSARATPLIRKNIKKQYEDLLDDGVLYQYDENPSEYKKARKRIQNRESANRVRNKKKVYVNELESEMTLVRQENTELKLQNAALKAENNLLKQQNCFLEKMAMTNGSQQAQPQARPSYNHQGSFEDCLLPLVNKVEAGSNSNKFNYIRAASPHTFKKHAVFLGVFTVLLCTYGLVPQEDSKGDLYAGNLNEFKNGFSLGVKSVNEGRASVPGYHAEIDHTLNGMIKANQEYNFLKSAVKTVIIVGYILYFIYVMLITNWKYVLKIKNTKLL